MRRVLITLLLAMAPLVAQEKKEERPPDTRVQKLFILKYADPRSVADLLRVFDATVVPNTEMHALAITGRASQIPTIEEAITRLDAPASAPKNIELTCYLVVGGEGEGSLGGPLPKELESVATQLRNTFSFKNYRLLDVLNMRVRTGQQLNTTSSGGGTPPLTTTLMIRSMSLAPDGTTVRIDGLRTGTRVPVPNAPGSTSYTVQELGMNTDLDIKEGQKVVVGRVGITRDQALFLVMMAKVVS